MITYHPLQFGPAPTPSPVPPHTPAPPPQTPPPAPDLPPPEVEDPPPDEIKIPVHEPPVMPTPMAFDTLITFITPQKARHDLFFDLA